MIGFTYGDYPGRHRRPVYSNATGRKLGYICHDARGRQTFEDMSGQTLFRILRWKEVEQTEASASLGGTTTVQPDI